MLPSSGRSIGEQSVTTLPANRSIILADSRYRKADTLDDPYNFNCDLGGTAIYAKEIYYQKLFWNQPIFSHNNASAELLFQMNGDTSITYVVYALPFAMFTQYDGNAPGTSLLTPIPGSYASMMEVGLNTDVRTLPFNTTLVNGDGAIRDPTSPGTPINIRFRYSPSRGFCIYPVQASPTLGYYYSIRLLPCGWVNNAHYVHGFGFFDTLSNVNEYVPHDFFATAIWSDCTPNLLPTRYIVIQSTELNKDRRLISFHNGNSANFVNELGIFSINSARTGIFHEVGVGDDATVISLRDDYTPQTFRIQISDEYGNQIRCSDNLGTLLQSGGIDPAIGYSFISSTSPSFLRGNSDFINFLVFGYQRFNTGVSQFGAALLNDAAIYPSGMENEWVSYQYINQFTQGVAQTLDLSLCAPLMLLGPTFTATPGGFGSSTAITSTYLPNNNFKFTPLTWYPGLNQFPTVRWDFQFENAVIYTTGVGRSYFYLVMFDASTFQTIMAAKIDSSYTVLPTLAVPITVNGAFVQNWARNPSYPFPALPATINIGYCVAWVGDNPSYQSTYFTMYGPSEPPPPFPQFSIDTPLDSSGVQINYVPPNLEPNYEFGDPLAIALCEEVIHEIAAILEYN